MKAADKITQILRQKVVTQAPGEKLPSIRSLMSRYRSSLHSVNIALERLEADGLLTRKKGSGIYVSPQKGIRFIELHRHHYPSANMDAKEISLATAIAEAGWKMVSRRHPVHGDDPDIQPNPKTSAHVVMSPIFETNPSFFRQITDQSTPILLYGQSVGPLNLDYVTGDDYRYMSLLVKHLHALGHRQIALLANEPGMHFHDETPDVIHTICGLLDMPKPVIIDCNPVRGESSLVHAYHGLKHHLQSVKRRPIFTALITASAKGVIGSLRALHEAGIDVPRACSLASFGMSVENAFLAPSVTEVGVTEAAWGAGAVAVLKQRFENPQDPPIGMKLTPEIVTRESTVSPPASSRKRAST
jgi:DNA-binding transcriptional regulator YhcF (GntR family)